MTTNCNQDLDKTFGEGGGGVVECASNCQSDGIVTGNDKIPEHQKEEQMIRSSERDQTIQNENEAIGEGDVVEQLPNDRNNNIESPLVESLNSVYGNRIGIIQSLSLLLNCILMVYAHVGVSALILSNQQRVEDQVQSPPTNGNTNNDDNNSTLNSTGACTIVEQDVKLWENGGSMNRSNDSNYCSRQFVWDQTGQVCLLNPTCISECFQTILGYSTECSSCFGAVPTCGLQNGCAGSCSMDHLSLECEQCNIPCRQQLDDCTGFTSIDFLNSTNNDNNNNNSDSTSGTNNTTTSDNNNINTNANDDFMFLTNDEVCIAQQSGVDWSTVVDRNDYNVVYTLRFTHAVLDAWNGNAKVLAVLVVLFSGVWPYAKNVILMITWYLPLTSKTRCFILTMLKRLGKYTFVDIFVSTYDFSDTVLQILLT
jgi:hypothetical protein